MTAKPQVLAALAVANEVRLGQSGLRRELAAGAISIVDALQDQRAERMPVARLLSSQVRWGPDRSRRLLGRLDIAELRPVGELTVRQAKALINHFDPPAEPAVELVPQFKPGMHPQQVDARVCRALLAGPVTRVELELRMREMCLPFDDLDASLYRLTTCLAVVVKRGGGYELFSVNNGEGASAA
jgi:hypothetical protein